jgi:zinc transport system substrate-binding protein
MADHDHHDDKQEHHEEHQQEPGGLDPHIWLSPALVKIQARKILNALRDIDPGHQAIYEANYRQFIIQIDQLDTELKKIFAGRQGLQFMVLHPAWGYFARDYGLKQVPVEIEGKSPKPAQLKKLIKHARRNDIKIVFVQPQFSSKSARLIANEIGGQVAFADPLAGNWSANLREVAEKFQAALK